MRREEDLFCYTNLRENRRRNGRVKRIEISSRDLHLDLIRRKVKDGESRVMVKVVAALKLPSGVPPAEKAMQSSVRCSLRAAPQPTVGRSVAQLPRRF